jgi:hypothetical protein
MLLMRGKNLSRSLLCIYKALILISTMYPVSQINRNKALNLLYNIHEISIGYLQLIEFLTDFQTVWFFGTLLHLQRGKKVVLFFKI